MTNAVNNKFNLGIKSYKTMHNFIKSRGKYSYKMAYRK